MVEVKYFEKAGPENTEDTLKLVKEYANLKNIKKIVIATTSGDTGIKASEILTDNQLIFVTHASGFMKPGENELKDTNKELLETKGRIITGVHSLSGVARSIRTELKTWDVIELIAYALRAIFCQGIKVVLEIVLMAVDSGAVIDGEEVIAVAGTGKGADTACVIKAAGTSRFFNLRVKEVVCKPKNF